jgi:hypothetical protein
VLGALGFVAEIVLFASVGVAAFRLVGQGPDGAVIAATAVVAAVIVWAVLMAPGASHRLGTVGRVLVVLVAGAAATVALVVTGGWRWPTLVGVATVVLLPATTRRHGEAAPEHVSRHGRSR